MRASLGPGLLLAAAVVLVIVVSSAWRIGLEPYALTGVAAGGVVALVPDRTLIERLVGFAIGVVACYLGFVLRAVWMPDTDGGRAVASVVVMLLCAVVAAAARGRLSLCCLLLGVAVFSGVYEAPFVEAEPQMASTSLDVATSLLVAVAAGLVLSAGIRIRHLGEAGGGGTRTATDRGVSRASARQRPISQPQRAAR